MRRCLSCGTLFRADAHTQPCPDCGRAVVVLEGVPCYAPELARESSGFRPEGFAWLAERESGHFWFRARAELIAFVVRRYFPGARNFLEIGCGTGFVLSSLAQRYPNLAMSGSEIFIEGLGFAARRMPDADLFQMDARRIPYRNEFDLLGAFDVIEHIEEDEQVLREVHAALVPGGGAIFTVPQHPSLWSAQDEHACHKRRYRRGELETKLRRAGFEILFSTSFVSVLLPLLYLSRRKKRVANELAIQEEMSVGKATNQILYRLLQAEGALIRAGLRFPAGGSRLVAARAKAD
jgi:SAM-dependent methyltransferase